MKWGDVDIINVDGGLVDGDGDSKVFGDGVVGEERVGIKDSVGEGMVNEGDETTPS